MFTNNRAGHKALRCSIFTCASLAACLLGSTTSLAANEPISSDASDLSGLGSPLTLSISNLLHDHGDGWVGARPDAHAPIGVMGDHVHAKGEWMLSYRYMSMTMDGSQDGHRDLDSGNITSLTGFGFLVTPLNMTMQMHMLGAMYAPSDDWTLMAMVPWLENEMDHRNRAGLEFSTRSRGLGDIRIGGLRSLWRGDRTRAHLNLNLSLPTGSINAEDQTPLSMGMDTQLPYPMQLGSGTYDLMPGITVLGQEAGWSWGAQAIATLRTGENSNDYRLGNRQDATTWISVQAAESLSLSTRLAYSHWNDIHGADPDLAGQLAGMIVPTVDPKLRSGDRLDILFGLNWTARAGSLKGHRLALEIGWPLAQDLDGPQLETDVLLSLGWQLAF